MGAVTLARDATLTGTGLIAGPVAGGLISPGDHLGILTADSTGSQGTTASGLGESFAPTDYAFEFTRLGGPLFENFAASGNDVLRLTSMRGAFTDTLSDENQIYIYLAPDSQVQPGDTFLGGFYTDDAYSFRPVIENADFRLFLQDPAGDTTFHGTTYNAYDANLVEVDSVPQTANFGSGTVNGYIMQVKIIPEPAAGLLLLAGTMLLSPSRRRRAQ